MTTAAKHDFTRETVLRVLANAKHPRTMGDLVYYVACSASGLSPSGVAEAEKMISRALLVRLVRELTAAGEAVRVTGEEASLQGLSWRHQRNDTAYFMSAALWEKLQADHREAERGAWAAQARKQAEQKVLERHMDEIAFHMQEWMNANPLT